MGKSRSSKSPEAIDERDRAEFDPFLGLVLGETWWQLGKNFSSVLTGTDQERARFLEKWVSDLREDLREGAMVESLDAITPAAITHFVSTVTKLLEKKYDGDSIARDVIRLTKKASSANVYDDGRYVDIQEPTDVFWATEYEFLFADLGRPSDGVGWLNAVTRCDDPECRAFFVKKRQDHRYHTDSCRTRTANREAYRERTDSRPHVKRGRPRISSKKRIS